jgi:hypothetical protein
LAGVRLITGSSVLLWQNLYDLRDYFAHSSTSGSSGGGGAPTDAQYVVMALDGTLSDERVLTAGTDIDLTDGGAGGNATVGVSTGTFSRPGHTHYSAAITDLQHAIPIYEDDVFVATGTIIDFGTNVNVSATGSVVYVSTVDTTGGGGGDLLIYDDSVFSVTGTAISFDDNIIVHVTGSIAYIEGVGVTGSAGPAGDNTVLVYDDSVFKSTGTAISFDNNLDVSVTGSVVFVDGQAGGGSWQTSFFATDNEPPSSSYATFDTVNSRPVLDHSAGESSIFSDILHPNYSNGGLNLRIGWSATGSSGSAYFQISMERLVTGSSVDSDSFATAVDGSSANAAGHVLGLATLSLSNGSQMDNAVAGDYFRLKFTYVSGTFSEDFELHFIELQEQ